MSEKAKGVRFGLVFAGLVFLFNPVVQLHDILPDALGMLLVYFGLKKAAYADGYFEDARKISFYLVWLYTVKLAFSFSLFGYPENALPYTFIASVLEVIFVFAFFKKLYKGFEYTSMRSEGDSVHPTGEACTMSLIFTGVKCVVTFLPELLEFMKQNEEIDLSANASYTMSVAVLKPYAVALSVFAQLILGIVFLVQTRKFFKGISKDKEYLAGLYEKYSNELELNRHKYVNKTLSCSIYLFIASMVFMADVNVEGIDVLPDVFAAFLLALAVYSVKSLSDMGWGTKIMCLFVPAFGLVYTAFSAYVKPEMFELLSGERSFVNNHSEEFWLNGKLAALYAAVSAIFALLLIVLAALFVIKQQRVYKNEMLGNHDRKLLTVFGLSAVCSLCKGAYAFFSACAAHLATNPAVAKFISARPRMTEQHMADEISKNSLVAQFDNVDTFATVFMYAVIVIAVFAVFNGYALKAEAVKEE